MIYFPATAEVGILEAIIYESPHFESEPMASDQLQVERSEADTESIPRIIIQRIAAITEQESTELPPLYETIDPDALDVLLNSIDENDASFSIEFTYAGQHVSINTDGAVSCCQD